MAIMDPYGLIVFLIDNDGNVGVTFLIASLIYSDMTKVLQSLPVSDSRRANVRETQRPTVFQSIRIETLKFFTSDGFKNCLFSTSALSTKHRLCYDYALLTECRVQ